MPLLRRIAPTFIMTSEQLGRAMQAAGKKGTPKAILEVAPEILKLAAGPFGNVQRS